ncbi:MAG TPA: hypothetical protein VMP01_13840 [Pirellulaceae bacterium]|nr:hypothetical protein [Pirellulaceae bacterium]
MSSMRKSLTAGSLAILLAAVVGAVALGWLTGRWLPLNWNRSRDDRPSAVEVRELALADQVKAAKGGAGATIHVSLRPIKGPDIAELGQLKELQVLQLDHLDNDIGDEDCQTLARLHELVHLRIRGGSIGDEGLAHLAALPKLKILNLPQSRVTDRGLRLLANAPRLSQLRLGSPQITDDGLKSLGDFPALQQLHLIDAPITDEGLETIAALAKLESLYLDGSRVTDAGLDRLFRARPDLHVHINQQHHDRDPRRGHE